MHIGLIVDGAEVHIEAMWGVSSVSIFLTSLSGADGQQGCYAFACR